MDTKERHIRENESSERRAERAEKEGYLGPENADMIPNARRRKDEGIRRSNKLWLWLGVLILIFILLWWLWSIGTFADLTGVTNG